LQCFFVVENFTANAVSVAIGDNGNRLIFEIWWNFFYDLFSIADVNSIDSFVSKRNMEEFSVVIMKRFRSKNIHTYVKLEVKKNSVIGARIFII
jgi:hypothetical protein